MDLNSVIPPTDDLSQSFAINRSQLRQVQSDPQAETLGRLNQHEKFDQVIGVETAR